VEGVKHLIGKDKKKHEEVKPVVKSEEKVEKKEHKTVEKPGHKEEKVKVKKKEKETGEHASGYHHHGHETHGHHEHEKPLHEQHPHKHHLHEHGGVPCQHRELDTTGRVRDIDELGRGIESERVTSHTDSLGKGRAILVEIPPEHGKHYEHGRELSARGLEHHHEHGKEVTARGVEHHHEHGRDVTARGVEHRHEHHDVLYKEGKRTYTKDDGTVIVEHVHPIEHVIERMPVIEEIKKDVVVKQHVIPEEVVEVHRHIHPVEKEIVKEHIHPKQTTEIHERVHEIQTREIHEHIRPIIEQEVRKDVYLPEHRNIEEKSIDKGEVSRTKVVGTKGDIPRDATVIEHMHHTEHKTERVPVMEATEKNVEVKREFIPEHRTVVHRHVHPVAKEIVQEHIHPREVTEVHENVHERRVREVHEHIRPEEVKEVRKDVYLPEERRVKEKYVDVGETSRERIDVDVGEIRGVIVDDKPVVRDVRPPVQHEHHQHIREASHHHHHHHSPEHHHHHHHHDKKIDIQVDFDVDEHGHIKNREVKTNLHKSGTATEPKVEIKTEKKTAGGH